MRATRRAAHLGANKAQRELAREQFIERETLTGRMLRRERIGACRPVRGAQRLGEGGKLVGGENAGVLPFWKVRQARQRFFRRAQDIPRLQALGEAVDGFICGELRQSGFVEHAVRMHDLAAPVIKLDASRNPARRAKRQAAFDPVGIGEKEHEFDVAGVILDEHAIGRFRISALRATMLGDARLQHDHRLERRGGDRGPHGPVDDGRRKMEKQIDEARFRSRLGEEPVEQFGGLRPDAGQCGDATEDGIEQRGTHEGSVQLADAERVI